MTTAAIACRNLGRAVHQTARVLNVLLHPAKALGVDIHVIFERRLWHDFPPTGHWGFRSTRNVRRDVLEIEVWAGHIAVILEVPTLSPRRRTQA